jgi:hypothetical protein
MIIGEKNTDLKRLLRLGFNEVAQFLSKSKVLVALTKTSLFDRNWATSLKPRRRSRPLRLVW